MSEIRFDPYAPTPHWTPPPRDDAPVPDQQWTMPLPCDPRNVYGSPECRAVALEMPGDLGALRVDDEWSAAVIAPTGLYASSSAQAVHEPGAGLLMLAAMAVAALATRERGARR